MQIARPALWLAAIGDFLGRWMIASRGGLLDAPVWGPMRGRARGLQ